jgi:hypothetical protein
MPIASKVLGQAALAATTLTDVYEVPDATEATISSVVICNRSSSDRTFRVSIAVGGEADHVKQYIAYDVTVPANDSVPVKVGPTLSALDVVRVYASTADLSVNIFGQERT